MRREQRRQLLDWEEEEADILKKENSGDETREIRVKKMVSEITSRRAREQELD
jgi:hypothetical protein